MESEEEWKTEEKLGKGWKKKSVPRTGNKRVDHYYLSPDGIFCDSMAKVKKIIEMAGVHNVNDESSPDFEEPAQHKVHTCDIKLKNLFNLPEYLKLKEHYAKPKIKLELNPFYSSPQYKTKNFSIKVKNIKLGAAGDKTPSTNSAKSELNHSNGLQSNGCDGKESGKNLILSNGNKSEGSNGPDSLPSTSRQSAFFTGRQSQQSTSKESRISSIAGRTSRLSLTSSMSIVTDSSGISEESSGCEIIGHGRKTVNGYEYEDEEDDDDDDVVIDSSDSDEDGLEDREMRIENGEVNGHQNNKEDSSRTSSSLSKNSSNSSMSSSKKTSSSSSKKPGEQWITKNMLNHKRKMKEIFLDDSDSENEMDRKVEDSDHIRKIIPDLGPPSKKKKSSHAEIILDDSAYFEKSSSRPGSVTAEDSATEESWKLDPETGDWKLEGSNSHFRLKELYIKVKEEHCYNSRMKSCYLKFRNVRKMLNMKNRAFDDPIKYGNRPCKDDPYGGMPCPFNCGAEFFLKDQLFFYEHVQGTCPVLKAKQIVTPERMIPCGVCRSEVPQSQLEDHHNNFHRPHPCPICQSKWQTEVEQEEHILEEHASHFVFKGLFPPILKKHLITVWQTKHQKPGDLIPASQVFQRNNGLIGGLIPVQCQPGQVFQRGPDGDVIPMNLGAPGKVFSGAFTPVQEQPDQCRLGPNGELTQVQPVEGTSIPQAPNSQVAQKAPTVLSQLLPLPQQDFQTGANGQKTYLKGQSGFIPQAQQGQVFIKLPDGKMIPMPTHVKPGQVLRLPGGQIVRMPNQPLPIPNQPLQGQFLKMSDGQMVRMPTQPLQGQVSKTSDGQVVRMPTQPLQGQFLKMADGQVVRMPTQPLQGQVLKLADGQMVRMPTQPLRGEGFRLADGRILHRMPIQKGPGGKLVVTPRLSTNPGSEAPVRPPLAAVNQVRPLSNWTPPVSGSQTQSVSGSQTKYYLPASKLPEILRNQLPESQRNAAVVIVDRYLKGSIRIPPGSQLPIQPGSQVVTIAIQTSSPTPGPSHFSPIHPAGVSGERLSVVQRVSPLPESSILKSQLARPSQVKIPPQYAIPAVNGSDQNTKVIIPPQYRSSPPPYARPTPQMAAPLGYTQSNVIKATNLANIQNSPPVPAVDRDGAPLMDVDADGAPTIFQGMQARFNSGQQNLLSTQPSRDLQSRMQDFEDTLSDPGVDPLEDPGVDPLEDPGVDPLEDTGVDPLEDPLEDHGEEFHEMLPDMPGYVSDEEDDNPLCMSDFCSAVMGQESEHQLYF